LKQIKLLRNSLILIIFVISTKIISQDLHYSQFYNSPQNYNPAQVGVFNGDHRMIFSLRDQWRFVPVPWFTFSGAYDRQVYLGNSNKQFFGAGVNFNHDRQGDSKLNLTSLNFSGAYHYLLTPQHIVSGGIVLGFSSRGFDANSLTWDKQWNGEIFNANLPSGENFDAQRVNFIENGLGVNYRYQKSSRTHIDLGGAVYHLINPTAAFYNTEDTKLPRHFSFTGIGNVEVAQNFDVQLHALHQIQGVYKETIFGGLAKAYLNNKPGKRLEVHGGLGYRTSKSFIPTLAVQYNEIYVSLSYDVDTNEFNQILSSSRGGPEFHVRYIITNVKPMNDHKVCPIY